MASLRLVLPLLAAICATQGFRISTVGGNHGLVPIGSGGGSHFRQGFGSGHRGGSSGILIGGGGIRSVGGPIHTVGTSFPGTTQTFVTGGNRFGHGNSPFVQTFPGNRPGGFHRGGGSTHFIGNGPSFSTGPTVLGPAFSTSPGFGTIGTGNFHRGGQTFTPGGFGGGGNGNDSGFKLKVGDLLDISV